MVLESPDYVLTISMENVYDPHLAEGHWHIPGGRAALSRVAASMQATWRLQGNAGTTAVDRRPVHCSRCGEDFP